VKRLGRIAAFEIARLAAMLVTNNNDAPRIIYVAMVMPRRLSSGKFK